MLAVNFFRPRLSTLSRVVLRASPFQKFSAYIPSKNHSNKEQLRIKSIMERTKQEVKSMNTIGAINEMMVAGRGFNINFKDHFPALANAIKKDQDNIEAVKHILNNLHVHNNPHEVKTYLFLLGNISPILRKTKMNYHLQDLVVALRSLENIPDTNSPIVKSFIHTIAECIDRSTDCFSAEELSTALNCIHLTKRNPTESFHLIRAISKKIPLPQNFESGNTNHGDIERMMMTPAQFSWAIFGLRGMQSDHKEVTDILRLLPLRLHKQAIKGTPSRNSSIPTALADIDSSSDVVNGDSLNTSLPLLPLEYSMWDAQSVSQMLCGLSQMDSYSRDVQVFVKTVATPALQNCDGSDFANPLHLRNAMYGINNLSSFQPVVRPLVSELAKRIREGMGRIMQFPPLTSREVQDICYSLKSLSSVSHETIQLVDTLLPHINRCSELLTISQWSQCLYGMCFMNSQHSVTRALLRSLTELTEDVAGMGANKFPKKRVFQGGILSPLNESVIDGNDGDDALTSQIADTTMTSDNTSEFHSQRSHQSIKRNIVTPKDISSALFGIQNMSSHHEEVAAAIKHITAAITLCDPENQIVDGADISGCVYGLRNMRSKDPVVCALLDNLADMLHRAHTPPDTVSAVHFAKALRGLANTNSYRSSVRRLVQTLAAKIQLLHEPGGEAIVTCRRSGRVWSGEMVSDALYGMNNLNSDHDEVSLLLRSILPLMEMDDEMDDDMECVSVESLTNRSVKTPSRKFENQPDRLDMTMEHICHALYGLKNMSNDPRNPNSALVDEVLIRLNSRAELVKKCMARVRDKLSSSNRKSVALYKLVSMFSVPATSVSDAVFGLQRMQVTSKYKRGAANHPKYLDGPSDACVNLLDTVVDAYFLTQEVQKMGFAENVNSDWGIAQLSGALFGLINVDIRGHANASRLLRDVMHKIRSSSVLCPPPPNSLSKGSIPPRPSELVQLQKRRLYQYMLMLYGNAVVKSSLSPAMNRAIYITLLEFQSYVRLPLLNERSSKAAMTFQNMITELLGNKSYPNFDRLRHIEAFHQVYLHGFICDTVLVGYYSKWYESIVDSDDGNKPNSILHQLKPHREKRRGGDDNDDDSYSPSSGFSAKGDSSEQQAEHYYREMPMPINPDGSHPKISSHLKFKNTSSPELLEFLKSRASHRLVVVNLEFDGEQKELVGAETVSRYRDQYLKKMHNVTVKRIKMLDGSKDMTSYGMQARIISEFDSILEIE